MSFNLNVKKGIRFFPDLIQFEDRKSLWRICWELLQLTLFYRIFPSHYFTRHLYRKEVSNIKDYLPNKFLYKASLALNDLEAASILTNKLFFDLYYGKFMQGLPRIIMYNHGNTFMVGEKKQLINSTEEFESFIQEIIRNETAQKSIFIKKTYDSYGGKNIYRLTDRDFPMKKDKLAEMYKDITQSAFLFQDIIVQHKDVDRLNPACINTIRIDTFIDQDRKCELISAYMRMSIDGCTFVDNISSGGCFVGVDIDTGELQGQGFSSITISGGKILTSHPYSGIEFKGFQIPFWAESKNLVQEAAGLVPNLRLIGWDIAISEKGPILVEGNCGYDITGNDLVAGGYRANPVFRKVLKEMKYHKWI